MLGNPTARAAEQPQRIPPVKSIYQSQADAPGAPPSPMQIAGPPLGAAQPVAAQATAMTQWAWSAAQKGMLYSAKDELVQALALVAQAADVQQGGNTRTAALGAGLTALKEARDYSPLPGHGAARHSVADIARTHRTALLKQAGDLPPVVAQQQYYNFAQQQLALAVAGEPAGSQTLCALGKIQMAMASQTTDPESLDGPQALVFFQAALAVDARNYLAANELGVLLARYGQLADARRALLHSVSIQPHAEGWQNLAIVHQRLGETELARLAENERQLLMQGQAAGQLSDAKLIEWVDPKTFAARSDKDAGWPSPTAAHPPQASHHR
jgi:hypothetical protein